MSAAFIGSEPDGIHTALARSRLKSVSLPRPHDPCEDLFVLKVFGYSKCSTCRSALKWLDGNAIPYQEIPIRETPPCESELRFALTQQGGDLRKLFNTSGVDYRSMGLAEKLPTMSETDAIRLLTQNGNLIKRPFVIADDIALVGFKPEIWTRHLLKT